MKVFDRKVDTESMAVWTATTLIIHPLACLTLVASFPFTIVGASTITFLAVTLTSVAPGAWDRGVGECAVACAGAMAFLAPRGKCDHGDAQSVGIVPFHVLSSGETHRLLCWGQDVRVLVCVWSCVSCCVVAWVHVSTGCWVHSTIVNIALTLLIVGQISCIDWSHWGVVRIHFFYLLSLVLWAFYIAFFHILAPTHTFFFLLWRNWAFGIESRNLGENFPVQLMLLIWDFSVVLIFEDFLSKKWR